MKNLTPDFIQGSKFDRDQTNHSLGTPKALSVSTQRQAGGGATRSHQQALLPRDGNRLLGAIFLMVTDIKMGRTKNVLKVFRSQAMTIPLSRLAPNVSHQVRNLLCLTKHI